ncbi:MAG: hypothetical protein JXP34_14860 [Planctomycetes bacterium]|nr:hypothetical protein [Planctomycetota bacterium]
MQFNLTSFIFSIVNFIVLVLLLHRFLYGPIRRAMDARAARIRKEEETAREAAAAAEAEREEYRRKTEAFEAESGKLRDEARVEAAKERERLIAAAQEEAEKRRAELSASLEREKATFIDEASDRIAVRSCEIARRILEHLADRELEERLVRRFRAGLADLEEEERGDWIRAVRDGEAVEVRTAFELPEKAKKAVAEGLGELEKLAEPPAFIRDAGLVCGIVATCGGHRLGWSVDGELDRLRASMEQEVDAFAASHAEGEAEKKGKAEKKTDDAPGAESDAQ